MISTNHNHFPNSGGDSDDFNLLSDTDNIIRLNPDIHPNGLDAEAVSSYTLAIDASNTRGNRPNIDEPLSRNYTLYVSVLCLLRELFYLCTVQLYCSQETSCKKYIHYSQEGNHYMFHYLLVAAGHHCSGCERQ